MTALLSRRSFAKSMGALACSASLPPFLPALSPAPAPPIVDSHIHLFDPTRPGGVPWPLPDNKLLYRPALPDRYVSLARPEGVIAAIAVECSPLASDNDWLLRIAATSNVMVGIIGDLDPARDDFADQIDRLSANSLFRGIRYGNLWNRDLRQQLNNQTFLKNLRHMARGKLVLESANPNPELVDCLLRLATLIPELHIVVDHLPQAVPPDDSESRTRYLTTLKQLSERPTVFVKGSEILRKTDDGVSLQLSSYKSWLDHLWELFGEDRLIFGSDWPNSDQFAPINDVFALARGYLATHSASASAKFFFGNSTKVYNWQPRSEEQVSYLRLATSIRQEK
jgi:L-fuconolactonase